MMLNLRVSDTAYILNSHRSRAHAAVIVAVGEDTLTAMNLDKGEGPFVFLRSTGEATGDYSQVSGAVPARLVPTTDPEAQALRNATEALRISTLHYDEVVECAANLKREATPARFELLHRAVDAWGDDLNETTTTNSSLAS